MAEEKRGMGCGVGGDPAADPEGGRAGLPICRSRSSSQTRASRVAASTTRRSESSPTDPLARSPPADRRPAAGRRGVRARDGERRLRAAKIAELETVPAVVRDADDWERLILALAENMAREDLNLIDEARACAMLVE